MYRSATSLILDGDAVDLWSKFDSSHKGIVVGTTPPPEDVAKH